MNKEFKKLENENLEIRLKILKELTELTDKQRKKVLDLIVDLIENELKQEELCNG